MPSEISQEEYPSRRGGNETAMSSTFPINLGKCLGLGQCCSYFVLPFPIWIGSSSCWPLLVAVVAAAVMIQAGMGGHVQKHPEAG